MSERAADALFYGLMLLLPLSALLARRIPLGRTLKMALAWVAIFGIGVVIVNQRDRLDPIVASVSAALGNREQMVTGSTVRIRMSDDGHFWANAVVNGTRRRMLIDSGATTTALSSGTASAAAIDLGESPFPTIINTANGAVTAQTGKIKAFALGPISAADLPVVVSPAFGDTDVIGMNFLSRLKSWRVEGRTLILEPAPNLT